MRGFLFCCISAFASAYPSSYNSQYEVTSEKPIAANQPKNDEGFRISQTALQELSVRAVRSSFQKNAEVLVFLGQSPDGKAIFLDDGASLSWQEAREHCRTQDLRLLSITSQEQQTFVLSRLPSEGTFQYWNSAHEHRWESGFWWDEINTQPKFMTQWTRFNENAFPYKLCAVLERNHGNAARDGLMQSRQCADQRPVLCEAYSH